MPAKLHLHKIKLRTWIGAGLVLVLLPIVIATFYKPSSSEAAWFDDTFAYRQKITFTHNAALTDRRVSVTIDTATLTTDKMQADCDDSRFTSVNGEVLLFQLVSGCDTSTTVYDVIFPTIINGANEAYVYYGNTSAVSASRDVSSYTSLSPSGGSAAVASEEKGNAPLTYWSLDQGTDNTCSGGTNDICDGGLAKLDGAISGAIWTPEDRCLSGKCLEFDGSNDSVDFGNQTLLNFERTNAFSVSVWMKTMTDGGMSVVSKQTAAAGNAGWNIQTGSLGYIFFQLVNNYGSNAIEVRTSNDTNYDDNRWHHILVTYDGSSNASGVKIYFDGANQTLTTTQNNLSSTAQTSTNVHLGSRAGGAQYFNGFLDEAKIYNYARTSTQAATDYASRGIQKGASVNFGTLDTKFLNDGLIGYWPMDEASWTNNCSTDSALDKSGNGLNGDSCPNTTGSTTPVGGKFGNAGDFDGTNDYVNLGANAANVTNNFTLAAWINVDSSDVGTILSRRDGSTTQWQWLVEDSGGNHVLRLYDGTANFDSASSSIRDGNWHHVVSTINGGVLQHYVNGVPSGSAQTPSISSQSVNTFIGARGDGGGGGTFHLDGQIDEVRVYNRVLAPSEILAMYNWAPGPVGHWKMDEKTGTSSITDSSSNSFNGTMNGSMTQSDWVTGKFGSALDFDGSNDYIGVTASGPLHFTPNMSEFTFTAWVKIRSCAASGSKIIEKAAGGNESALIECRSSNNFPVFARYGLNGSAVATGTTTINDNTWHHIAGVMIGRTAYIYVDGTLEHSNARGNDWEDNLDSENYRIGASIDGAGREVDGVIDEVKIYNYARTPGQIIEDMNGGHPIGGSPIGSQIRDWHLNDSYGQIVRDGTGNDNGELAGSTTTQTADPTWTDPQNCKNGGCLDFESSESDYVGSLGSLAMDNKSFSVSAWAKRESIGANMDILSSGSSSQHNGLRFGFVNTNVFRCGFFSNDLDTTNTYTDTDWHHWSCTYNADNNSRKIYRDGVLVASDTASADFQGTGSTWIGAGISAGSNFFDGLIDEVKIYNAELTVEQVNMDMNANAALNFGVGSNEASHLTDGAGNPPIGHWNMDEKQDNTCTGGTNDVCDRSGNGYDGSISGATWRSGKIGSALNFDGSDDSVTISNTTVFNVANAFTIGAWIYPRTCGGGSNGTIFTKTNELFFYICESTNNLAVFDDFTTIANSTNNSVTMNTWQYVSVVHDGAGNFTFYVNGRNVTNDSTATMTDASGSLLIGASNSAGFNFNGLIDEVKLYNYARTQAQVAYDYNRGGPLAHWQFDECQGTTANDASGNALSGTLTPGASGNTAAGSCSSGTSTHMWYNGATGKINSSLDFDGIDDYVALTDNSIYTIDPAQDYTWTAWINPATLATDVYGTIWTQMLDSDNHFTIYALTNTYSGMGPVTNGVIATWQTPFPTNMAAVHTVDNAISTGSWFHIAVTYDASLSLANRLTVYINGVDRSNNSDRESGGTLTSLNPSTIRIGATGNASEYFDGKIDDTRMYNYLLSESQIKKVMNDSAGTRFGPTTGQP